MRDCVPSSRHGSPPKSQGPHASHVLPPQLTPSVEGREQPCVSVRLPPPPHVPPLHTADVQVRDWLPLVPQGSAKPPQLPHPVHESAPQLVPSVARVQATVSARMLGWQLPPPQT